MIKKQQVCPPKCDVRRRILVTGMGTSPAVLTNAVWALVEVNRVNRVKLDCHSKMPQ